MKTYLILDFKITDADKFMQYVQQIPAYIQRHQGKYIVEGVKPEVVEGSWQPDTLVVLEFPSAGQARDFLDDPDVQPLFVIRHAATESNLVLVEGGSWRDNLR
ncbi:MAG: DUF1330 domain-containing protein [Pseudomonadales bacterium]|nr:DUF1330 domain-containing protein [Pseudomonadales bacterium]